MGGLTVAHLATPITELTYPVVIGFSRGLLARRQAR